MGHQRVVGRPAPRAASFQQGGLEPAAMLVRAFEIDVRRPGCVFTHLAVGGAQGEGVGRARIEPDIEDVVDLLVVVGVAARP